MSDQAHRAVAVVGVGAILPDAPDVATFWQNIKQGRYSISEVDPERWDPEDYYDPDPDVPDKTYCKIGGWVREYEFEPFLWRIPIPPKVQAVMDDAQKWAVASCRSALLDYGYPDRALDTSRTAVILGNAMAGEYHYRTSLRIYYPEYAHALESVPAFKDLPSDVRAALIEGMGGEIRSRISDITEDTMPGELSNIIAGRVANALNLHGPNFVTDAACASSFAALNAAVEGLVSGHFGAVLTGGVDRNMGAQTFVKFCKIGALSPDGSRPFAEGANGFVMGEGAAVFLLKRLADAERDGDRIYAVVRGLGGASDGKGKGITAPNPIGQQKAIERAWRMAGLSPAHASYIEGHGTSTRVGDVVEVESMGLAFAPFDLPHGSIPIGSVKSNIGHLKGAAGAAGMLKTVLALHEKVLPPTVNFHRPNPSIDFDSLPFYVNVETRPWNHHDGDGVRRAGISSFGFGGTNFHVVLEEHVPGMLTSRHRMFQGTEWEHLEPKVPYRGALVLGASNVAGLQARLKVALNDVEAGSVPPPQAPKVADLEARERIAIDFGDAEELAKRGQKAMSALETDVDPVWKPLASQGVYRGSGEPAGKVAFMFPGQGAQYVNMLRELCDLDPIVAETFHEADEVMTPLLGSPLTEYIFCDAEDKEAIKAAEDKLKDTTITQPAVLTVNVALTRLLATYGVVPDLVIGHSLGEYAALVAAGVLSFAEALHVVSARGREMTKVSVEDNGCMAAIFAPLEEVERILSSVVGYVVLANINSRNQVVIGGATKAIDEAIAAFQAADYRAVKLNVSHAFHTRIVAPASEPLKQVIARMDVRTPRLPIVANVTGELYPTDPNEIVDLLGKHIASPVQFVKGIETMYREGARIFVEVGPKRVLMALTEDILSDKDDITVLFTNHPRKGALPSLNEALCGLYAAGVARQDKLRGPQNDSPASGAPPTSSGPQPQRQEPKRETTTMTTEPSRNDDNPPTDPAPQANAPSNTTSPQPSDPHPSPGDDRLLALGQLFANFLEQGQRIYQGMGSAPAPVTRPAAAVASDGRLPITGSVVISGAALGLPGQDGKVFDADNVDRLLRGEQFIELIPYRFRNQMAGKRINRLVKGENGASFEVIDDPARTIKLAGRGGYFDLAAEFGVSASRIESLDISTQLAIGAGIEALRDAGVPLVMHYRTTSKGTYLPDRWMLPQALADETGIIFASAFPGLDRMADETNRFHQFRSLNEQLKMLTQLRGLVRPGHDGLGAELDRRIANIQDELARLDYKFDRRFIFRVLAMGHSQFAEYIGARGPNTHVNAACATTTHAIAVAEDWIRAGRCRRVIVIAGDDVTSENLMEWIGSGLLATGATTTEERLDRAALPFDRRRHGTIIGMGAAAIVIEAEDAIRERGMRGICEILSSQIANSAFHGTRLDVEHICEVMDRVVGQAEERFGIERQQIAPQTVFVSHETYTPARGGSAAAEIHALRQTFGDRASQVVIANTKGYTGHAMGVGIEDVLAIKSLEHGTVPAVANINNDFQPDPELGDLNLSRGGRYPVQYALRLGAGFGSQIAMTLLRKIPGDLERIDNRQTYDRWLSDMAGHDQVELEVENHTLRVRDVGPPTRTPARSTWTFGRGPIAWASTPDQVPITSPIAPPSPPLVRAPAAPVQAPPQPATVAPPQPAPAAPVSTADPVAEQVLALVSEKTGYPPDMLDMDLDLEADLGIDTVKQAEVFVTIRETYDIPRRDDLKLRDYNTLTKVVAFVHEMRPDLATAAAPRLEATEGGQAPAPAPVAPATPSVGPVAEQVLALVSEKTGYPSDMLDMDLDLEADLGIDTVKQAEVFATIRETYDIPRRDDLKLRDYNTLTKVVGFVHEMRPDLATAAAPPLEATEGGQAPAPAPVASAAPAVDPVTEQLLALVSEKTGYPPDMLVMDLDLEADLGIDTVKQAEVFVTIRETYDIPRRDDLKLRDYNTLTKVVAFVHEMRPDLATAAAPRLEATEGGQAPAPAPVAPATPSVGPVAEQVLALVSEKTGYPSDMLDMDLDLEADLGIDTVKQAEVFATIRETYDIPRRDDLKLRDYNTLTKVVGFVHEMRPDLATAAAPPLEATEGGQAPAPAPVASAAPAVDPVTEQLLALVSEKTGYPPDMLDMDLDLEADLGIDTVKQAEVFAAIRETYDIPRQENLQLRDYNTLAKVIAFVHEMRPDLATAAATPLEATEGGHDPVAQQVLALVSEKTGYPPDMLDMDLDLEADLGIDTVKQAEVFATIRETYDIPRQEDLQLRDYNTLAKVIAFVHEKRGDAQAPAPVAPAVEAPKGTPERPEATPILDPTAGLEAANDLPRRVPVPMLRPDLELCKPTGVEFGGDSRMIVVSDEGKTAKYLGYRLRARKTKALTLKGATPETVAEQVAAWLEEGPIAGVYFLPALDVEPPLTEMDLAGWRAEQEKRVKTLYTLMRALPEDTFLISGTRLGGLHGYGPEGATAPLGGAITGFTKAYARERPDALVKALDFPLGLGVDADDRKIAEILVDETLRDPGAVEIGYHNGQRYAIGLVERPVAGNEPDVTLDKDTVFVITGAAGGITAAIVGDLARASGGTFYLTDIGPAPDPDNPDLGRLEGEELKWLKRDIAKRIKDAGTRPTPVMVERELAALGRAASVVSAMREIERVGGTAHYVTCDVTDAQAVSALVEQVKREHGHLDVLVHAAGLERSHFLPDKDPKEFNLIFDVKADGFFNLLKATHAIECPLKVSVVFTSIAGRFGNAGQTDYSAANDLLCKVTSSLRATRPGCKAVAIDWSAWAGVGMATRQSIPEMMRRAGIDMLEPEYAVPVVRREVITGGTGGEVLIARALGILLDPRDPDGGIDLEGVNKRIEHAFPVAGQVTNVDVNDGFTFESELDPQAEPFLHDHALDDTPLLPGVMGVEGFAEIACLIASRLGSAKTSYRVAAIENVDFQAPFKFYRNEPRKLTWRASVAPMGEGLVTEVVLESVRELKTGRQQTCHFSGRVVLEPVADSGMIEPPTVEAPHWNGSATLEPEAIYRVYFHGPAFQVLEGVQSDGKRVVGKFRLDLPPMTGQPKETLVAPLLIELCLQTAGVWEIGKTGALALPTAIDQVIVHKTPQDGAIVYAEIEPQQIEGDQLGFDARVIDAEGNLYIELRGYRTARLPAPIDDEHVAPLRATVEGKPS